jgi:hypothetical protein
LATIVYTIGTLLLWSTTRRSVRALENAVKLTFLQMLYETKRPSGGSDYFVRDPSGMLRLEAERAYKGQLEAALQQAFPKLYGSVHAEEQTTVPEERQEGR